MRHFLARVFTNRVLVTTFLLLSHLACLLFGFYWGTFKTTFYYHHDRATVAPWEEDAQGWAGLKWWE